MDSRTQRSVDIINFIIKDLSLENGKKFSEALGFKRPERIYKILRGEVAISRNLAKIISDRYPKYDYDWLLTGQVSYKTTSQLLSAEEINKIVEAIYLFEEDLMQNNMFASWVKNIEAKARKEALEAIQNGLALKKISKIQALDMLDEALKIHTKNNINVEYEVFIDELKKLKSLKQKVRSVIEENDILNHHNEKLLQSALISDGDLKKNIQNILNML